MNNKKRSTFASFIGAIYIITIVAFCVSLGLAMSKGKEAAEKRLRKLTNETSESLKELNPRSEAFYDAFLHSLGNVSDLAGVQVKDTEGLIISYPAELGEEGIRFSGTLIKPFVKSTKLNARNGQEVTLTVAIYQLRPSILYGKLRIAFLVILAATLLCLLYLIYVSLYGNEEETDADEQPELIGTDEDEDPVPVQEAPITPEKKEEPQQPVPSPQQPAVIVNVNAVPGGAVTTETIRESAAPAPAEAAPAEDTYENRGFGNYELTQEEYDGLLSDEIEDQGPEDLDDFDPDDDVQELESEPDNSATVVDEGDDSRLQDSDVDFDEESDEDLFDDADTTFSEDTEPSDGEPSFVPGDAFENDTAIAAEDGGTAPETGKADVQTEKQMVPVLAGTEEAASGIPAGTTDRAAEPDPSPAHAEGTDTAGKSVAEEDFLQPDSLDPVTEHQEAGGKEASSDADDADLFEPLDEDDGLAASDSASGSTENDTESSGWAPREIPSIDDSIFEDDVNEAELTEDEDEAGDEGTGESKTELTEQEDAADADVPHETMAPDGNQEAEGNSVPAGLQPDQASIPAEQDLEQEDSSNAADEDGSETAAGTEPVHDESVRIQEDRTESACDDKTAENEQPQEDEAVSAPPAAGPDVAPAGQEEALREETSSLQDDAAVENDVATENDAAPTGLPPSPAPSGPSGLYSARTGFGWESYMVPRIDNEILRCTKSNQDISVVSLRIAGIDWAGEAGQAICSSVREQLNSPDLIFEKGDDAFTAALPDTGIHDAIAIAEDLYASIDDILANYGHDNYIGIGISSRSLRMISGERLSNEAEVALNHAMEDENSPIVAFKVDPQKYRNFLAAQAEQEEAHL